MSCNRTISTEELQRLKQQSGQLSSSMETAISMCREYTIQDYTPTDFAGINLKYFYNTYPSFTDTNNLSLVTFLQYFNFSIVFPGDLEVAGWQALLQDVNFCRALRSVNIFIASHHGRISGYCEKVFDFCSPEIIIISDTVKQFDTQETEYSRHAKGLPWDDGRTRKVLTTRTDGMIQIIKNENDPYRITTFG
jgi:beta-lactamase superfamily II metal-dependent hydrolase